MHHHFSTYYDLDKKLREDELARDLQHQQWVQDARQGQPRRRPRWRTLVASIVGFFF